MKTSLRLLGILLSITLLCSAFISCKQDTPPAATDAAVVSVTEEFYITRPARATEAEKTAARDIANALKALGINVIVKDDWYQKEEDIPKKEILVGRTNRAESTEALQGLAERDYSISVSKSTDSCKIVIAASGDKGITAAASYFTGTYLTGESANQFSATLSYRYTYEFPCENITVGAAATPLKDYTIVYAPEGVSSPVDPNYQNFIQTAKYEDVANAIADFLSDAANVKLNVQSSESASDDGKPKILVGNTSLTADDFAYTATFANVGDYKACLTADGNIVLAGDNACAAYAAGEALVKAMIEAKTNLGELNVSDTKKLIKIACVGDSITHGDGNEFSYPAYLQKMLGYNYYVEKYGAPGFSMTSTDTYAYIKHTSLYKPSQEAKADVVIIMLGTNDCNPNPDHSYKDWSDPARANNFKASATAMIKAYRRANPQAQIYLMTPPSMFKNETWGSNIKNYAVPLTIEAAESNKCYLIDIYTWSLSNSKVFYVDGLHPKNETYKDFAQAVYDGLKDTIKKPE